MSFLKARWRRSTILLQWRNNVIQKRIISCLLGALLALTVTCTEARTVYLKSGEEIDAESAWRQGGKVFVKVNRDALVDFPASEVNLDKTFGRKGSTSPGKKARTAQARSQKQSGGAQVVAPRSSATVAAAPQEGVPGGEVLFTVVPKGYKIAFQQRQGNLLMTEMVPQGQSVQAWTEMVTIQTFLGGVPQRSPEAFAKTMDDLWQNNCPGAESQFIRKGTENGYPFAFWLESCPRSPMTGKPEFTLMKGIQGNDSFYVVQKAWKSNPTKEEIASWSAYMAKVKVRDSRVKGRESGSVK